MAANEKPPAAGGGSRAQFRSARQRITGDDRPISTDRQETPVVIWRRAAYRAVQGQSRATAIVGLLPVAIDRTTLQTRAGNAWFAEETGLSDRAITYGIEDLVKAGMITSSTSGPRRQITLILPSGAVSKPAQDMRATGDALPAQNRRVARTQRADIEGRRLPLPPQAKRSIELGAQRGAVDRAEGEVLAVLGDGSIEQGRLIAAQLPREQITAWRNAAQLGALDERMIREIEAARPDHRVASNPAVEVDRGGTPAGNARVVLECLGEGSVARGRELAAFIDPALVASWTASVRGGQIPVEIRMSMMQTARRARLVLVEQSKAARAAS